MVPANIANFFQCKFFTLTVLVDLFRGFVSAEEIQGIFKWNTVIRFISINDMYLLIIHAITPRYSSPQTEHCNSDSSTHRSPVYSTVQRLHSLTEMWRRGRAPLPGMRKKVYLVKTLHQRGSKQIFYLLQDVDTPSEQEKSFCDHWRRQRQLYTDTLDVPLSGGSRRVSCSRTTAGCTWLYIYLCTFVMSL